MKKGAWGLGAVLAMALFAGCESSSKPEPVSAPVGKPTFATLQDALMSALDNLSSQLTNEGFSMVVEDVYLENSRVITPLSDYVKNALISQSLKGRFFKVVQSSRDFTAQDEKTFVYRTDADYDGVLMMNYYLFNDGVQFYFKLNDAASRTVYAAFEMKVPLALLPRLDSKPANYDQYVQFGQDQAVLDRSDFKTAVWTERGMNGIFKEGEKMVLSVYAETNCYIKIYHIAVDGKIQLIFPNAWEKQNRINARETVKFPSRNMPFAFVMTAPYGIETIRLIAQTEQFDDIRAGRIEGSGEGFRLVGDLETARSRGVYYKGLAVQGQASASVQKSESSYTYNIVE